MNRAGPRTLGDLLHTPTLRPRTRPGSVEVSAAVEGLRRGQRRDSTKQRRRHASRSIQTFCTTYLAHHFYHGFGEHHDDMFAVIDAPSPVQGKRVVRAEPRMFGKTTVISLALPLYCAAYKLKHYILLVGESGMMAQANLQTIVSELEENELLLKDFPHLVPHRDAKGQPTRWNDSAIMLQGGIMIVAKGMGSRMRGMKQGKNRPDLGICDDPQSPETASSFVTRQRHRRWFGGTFLGLGTEGWDVYVIGNMPHRECLVADLLTSNQWDGKLYRAINVPPHEKERFPVGNTKTDSSPLWPQVWPQERLDAYRADPTVGPLGFAREMMNEPRDEKDRVYDINEFEYIEWYPWKLSQYQQVVTFIDPAGGEKPHELKLGKKDWAAIVTGGRTKDGFIDIFSVILTRVLPDQQVARLLDEYEHWHGSLVAEENIAKNLLDREITRQARERQLYPSISVVTQTKNKVQRILGIQPLISSKVVRFAKHLRDSAPEFFEQWDRFPDDHDDGPDATEGLIRGLERTRVVGVPTGVGSGGSSYWRQSA